MGCAYDISPRWGSVGLAVILVALTVFRVLGEQNFAGKIT